MTMFAAPPMGKSAKWGTIKCTTVFFKQRTQLYCNRNCWAVMSNWQRCLMAVCSPQSIFRRAIITVHMPVHATVCCAVFIFPGDCFPSTPPRQKMCRICLRATKDWWRFLIPSTAKWRWCWCAMIVVNASKPCGRGRSHRAWRKIEVQDFVSAPAPVRLDKGEEMGRFKPGSTAIVLFRQSSDLEWEVKAGDAKMGQEFAD